MELKQKAGLKIGLLVSGGLGLHCLTEITRHFDVRFVLTNKSSTEIIQFCEQMQISCFVGNPRKSDHRKITGQSEIDLLFSINYLYLIEEDLIRLPKIAALNIHGSLLPKFRGRTPHVWAIIQGEKYTGITVHHIEAACDTGDIVHQEKIEILPKHTGADILDIFALRYPEIVLGILKKISLGEELPRIEQDESQASYFGKRTPEDGQINWDKSAQEVVNWVRAQSHPYPGAFTFYEGNKVIIDEVCEVREEIDSETGTPGEIILNGETPLVRVKDGFVRVLRFRDKIPNFGQDAHFN
ncbi:MAG: methionyl-tRNA formyltransferase [Bacteroidetes bacterium]|nr:MAG: methionyl-tRNA formyltransferase [Bacteroidota bacterium]